MSSGEDVDRFYDLLFEMSNDIRHNILLLLHQRPERMTQIAKTLDLTSPEVSRHLSRLSETMLIEKDVDNFYHVTNIGEFFLNSLIDLEFITKYRDYFVKHSVTGIPIKFQKRMSEISNYKLENNFMEFLRFITEKIDSAQEYVWMYIDQYPILTMRPMQSSVERGVKYRIIEQSKLSGAGTIFEKKHLISIGNMEPSVDIRINNKKDAYLFLSDQGSAISFPTKNAFDYTGFISDEKKSAWIKELFEYYWTPADQAILSCALCSASIHTDPIIETIEGKEYVFDTQECVLTFKRLKHIYGEYFK